MRNDPLTVAAAEPANSGCSSSHASHSSLKPTARGGSQIVCSCMTPPRRLCGEVRELRVALEEGELDRVGGAVSVLGQDQLGEPLGVRLLVVVLVAVHEHDEIGVLLDTVVTYDTIGDEIVPLVDGEIEHFLLAGGFDREDLVPVDVAGREAAK